MSYLSSILNQIGAIYGAFDRADMWVMYEPCMELPTGQIYELCMELTIGHMYEPCMKLPTEQIWLCVELIWS